MGRRTDAQIQEVERIAAATGSAANDIERRVNSEDDESPWISVNGGQYWSVKAPYQKDRATDIDISFTTKDAKLAEAVAQAMRAVLLKGVDRG